MITLAITHDLFNPDVIYVQYQLPFSNTQISVQGTASTINDTKKQCLHETLNSIVDSVAGSIIRRLDNPYARDFFGKKKLAVLTRLKTNVKEYPKHQKLAHKAWVGFDLIAPDCEFFLPVPGHPLHKSEFDKLQFLKKFMLSFYNQAKAPVQKNDNIKPCTDTVR